MERPLDKTQQDYVDHGGIVNLFQSLKHGLFNIVPVKTRDGKGGEVVTGLKRRSFIEKSFGSDYLYDHQGAIEDIRTMQTNGRLVSPFTRKMSIEIRSGGSGDYTQNHAAWIEDVRAKYDTWFDFCATNHVPARTATILVFGEECNFTEAHGIMRERGIRVGINAIKGLCFLGIDLYEQQVRKYLREKKDVDAQ